MDNQTAYLLTYNGLGDYITMIGALNFLSNYYQHIYMLCRKASIENMKLFLPDKPITYIPIEPTGYNIISNKHFITEEVQCIKIINETLYTVEDGDKLVPYEKSRIIVKYPKIRLYY